MFSVKKNFSIALFALTIGSTPLLFAAENQNTKHTMFTPAEIKWEKGPDTLPKGAQIAVLEGNPHEAGPFTIRLKFPANYQIPPHWHPNIEHLTVISGTLNLGLGDKFDKKETKKLPVGSFSFMEPKTHHFAYTQGPVIIQLHAEGPWGITYVDSKDEPKGNVE